MAPSHQQEKAGTPSSNDEEGPPASVNIYDGQAHIPSCSRQSCPKMSKHAYRFTISPLEAGLSRFLLKSAHPPTLHHASHDGKRAKRARQPSWRRSSLTEPHATAVTTEVAV